MPYVIPADRGPIDLFLDDIAIETPGELNYAITKLVHTYLTSKGTSYGVLNEIVGVLECAKQEFYRRKVVPYEDVKIRENGDV